MARWPPRAYGDYRRQTLAFFPPANVFPSFGNIKGIPVAIINMKIATGRKHDSGSRQGDESLVSGAKSGNDPLLNSDLHRQSQVFFRPQLLPPHSGKRSGISVGLHIGASCLQLAKIRRRAEVVELLDFRQVPISPAQAQDTAAWQQLLRQSLRDFCGGGVLRPQLWVQLDSASVNIRHLNIPIIDDQRLYSVVYWTMQQELPFADATTVFDFTIEGTVRRQESERLAVMTMTALRDEIADLQSSLTAAGFAPAGITLPPFSGRNFFLPQVRNAAGSEMLFYFGNDYSHLNIVDKGRSVQARNIHTGLNSLVESLLHAAPIALERASALQLLRGPLPDPTLLPLTHDEALALIQPALDRLAQHIEQSLNAHLDDHRHHSFECLHLIGPVGAYPAVIAYLESQLHLRIHLIDPFANISNSGKTAVPPGLVERHAFCDAIGLALSSNGATPNLWRTFQQRQQQRLMQHKLLRVFAVAALLTLAVVGLNFWQQQRLRQLAADYQSIVAAEQQRLPAPSWQQLSAMAAELRQLRHAETVAMPKYMLSALLHDIVAATPAPIQLRSIDAQRPAATDGNDSNRRRTIISGEARLDATAAGPALTAYIFRLENSPLIESARLLGQEQSANITSFRLELQLAATLPGRGKADR